MAMNIKALILDVDGVLWRGSEPIGDLAAIFERIHACGLKAVLATNNATRTAPQFIERAAQLGLRLELWQVLTSAHVAARYLRERFPSGGPVYIVGEDGITQALLEQGFCLAEAGERVLAVVAGIDRGLTYEKLRRATLHIRSGALFVGTNPDKTFPTPEGLVPGAGSVLAALEAASGVAPLLMGKPLPALYQLALERLGCTPQETLVVGDRLETDIVGAQAIGCHSALVLSGVSTEAEACTWQPPLDIIAADLAAVVDRLTADR